MTRRKQNISAIEPIVRQLLKALGEDPNREGLRGTPKRVMESFRFLTRGYFRNAEETIVRATFNERYNQNAYATTSAMLGAFESHERTRLEFLSFLRREPSR